MKIGGSGSATSVRGVHKLGWVVLHKTVRHCLVDSLLPRLGHRKLDAGHESVSWPSRKSRCEAAPDVP